MSWNQVLTPEQWLPVRKRWEDSAQSGFEWVAREVRSTYGVALSRAAVGARAKREGWAKAGAIANTAGPTSSNKRTVQARLPNGFEPELTARMLAYFSVPIDVAGMPQFPALVPTAQRFAHSVGFRLADLEKVATALDDDGRALHPEFAAAFARVAELQQACLIEGAAAGVYSPEFAVLVLGKRYSSEPIAGCGGCGGCGSCSP